MKKTHNVHKHWRKLRIKHFIQHNFLTLILWVLIVIIWLGICLAIDWGMQTGFIKY